MRPVDGGQGQTFREDVERATRVTEEIAVLIDGDAATLLIVRHGMRLALARDERMILSELLAKEATL